MEEVMRAERALGKAPRDVSALNQGWDVESLDPRTGSFRFIEVKGRVADDFAREAAYVRGFPFREPGEAAVTLHLRELLARAAAPG
jgi:hypothetical protein